MPRKSRSKKTQAPQPEKNMQNEMEKTLHKTKYDVPINSGKSVVKGIYLVFMGLALFYLWNAFNSLTTGSFSMPLLLTLALGGFLVSFLSRQLAQSAYFSLYKTAALLFFLPIAVIFFYRSNIDGFVLGFLAVFSSAIMILVIIPYFFEGIEIDKAVMSSIIILFILSGAYITFAMNYLVPRTKALDFQGIYPPGVVFQKENNLSWIYGDNRLLRTEGNPVIFKVIKTRHPEAAIKIAHEQELERQKEAGQRGNNKKKNEEKNKIKDSETPETNETVGQNISAGADSKNNSENTENNDIKALEVILSELSITGESFTASVDRTGNYLALTADTLEGTGKSSVLVIDLNKMEKMEVFSGDKLTPFFPSLSFSYGDYTTWDPSGRQFFYFVRGGEENSSLKLYAANIDDGSSFEIPLDNVISACWSPSGELRIITGEEDASLHSQVEELLRKRSYINRFNLGVMKGSIYRWQNADELPEKLADLPADINQVIVHPLSGQIFALTDRQNLLLTADSEEFSLIKMEKTPDRISSIISPDGKLAAGFNDGIVWLQNIKTGEFKTLEVTSDKAVNFTFTYDSRYLIYTSVSKDNFFFVHSNIVYFDLEKNTKKTIFPNMLTGDFRAGRNAGIPATVSQGYYVDPADSGIYFEQIKSINPFTERSLEVSLWKVKTEDTSPKSKSNVE